MYQQISGVILAGGQATRMGGEDKGLMRVGKKRLYQYALEKLQPQVKHIAINANRHIEHYEQSKLRVFSDLTPNFSGPLAGMLAGLYYATTHWVVFVPCDVPDFPDTLVSRLWSEKEGALISYACDEMHSHPTFALLHTQVTQALANYLASGGRKLMHFFTLQNAKPILFTNSQANFYNLNTKEDCQSWIQKRANHYV